MVPLSTLLKIASFRDVRAIYDSLPEDQKKLVAPRGEFVDSPNLKLRTVTPEKDGFAEAYSMPGDKAFVTLAVSPKAQGQGKGTELLQQIIAKARAEKVKKLVYRLNSSNKPSLTIVRKFVDGPIRKGKDWEEYAIDPTNVRDPYAAKLPPEVTKAMEVMKGVYKDMGYDLSDVEAKGTTRSRYESGAVAPYGVLAKKLQVGASWVPTDNSVYFHPDLEAAMKLYGVKGSKEDFAKSLAAHELAHAVDQRYADDALRKKVLQQAKDSGFTTSYLDNLPFKENRDKELFAEYLAHQATT